MEQRICEHIHPGIITLLAIQQPSGTRQGLPTVGSDDMSSQCRLS